MGFVVSVGCVRVKGSSVLFSLSSSVSCWWCCLCEWEYSRLWIFQPLSMPFDAFTALRLHKQLYEYVFFSLSLLSLLRSRVNLIFLVWSVQSIIFIDFRRVLVPNPAIAIKKMNSHLKDLPCSRLWWSSLESAKKSQSTGICMNFLSHSAALHPSTWQSTLEESFALMQMHTHTRNSHWYTMNLFKYRTIFVTWGWWIWAFEREKWIFGLCECHCNYHAVGREGEN